MTGLNKPERIQMNYSWAICDKFKRYVMAHRQQHTLDCIVGILRGGAVPAVIMSNILRVPVYWVVMRNLDTHGFVKKAPGFLNLNVDTQAVLNKSVMVVDDLWNTGHTMSSVIEFVLHHRPKKISGCVMVTKDATLKHRGLNVAFLEALQPNDWVVFPWEE